MSVIRVISRIGGRKQTVTRLDSCGAGHEPDRLRAELSARMVEARRSSSRRDAGIVTFRHEGINQRGEVVCRATRAAFMRCRPEDGTGA
ncbi:hypothetical protein [Pseudonocardia acidicola]|uniref:hypothetical protein n=1 Tax=Pseudonocardia acidicola TaxID=2724939 RepID=UPI001B7D215F|nr:hypothetical protein [Pseudonocardia acidicola]